MDVDVVIVGGGLAGLALAAALRRTSLSIALIEGRAPAFSDALDSRIYAISPRNARFLNEIGIWAHLDPARLTSVAAMEIYGDQGGRLDFSAYRSGVSELAWIIESALIHRELWETTKRQGNIHLLCPAKPSAIEWLPAGPKIFLGNGDTFSARLVVAADGADSWTRSEAGIKVDFSSYQQLGVVANFATELPHRQTAFQWFRPDGVLAWLPLPDNRVSMVWSTAEANGRQLMELSASELSAKVTAAGHQHLGRMELISPAAGFPLRLMRAPNTVKPRLALIGDAAHTIHPLSGHGINLGFQDAEALASILSAKPAHVDCGDLLLLRAYERARIEDVVALQTATDGLHHLFGPSFSALSGIRNLGLNLTNTLPVVKDLLVRYALAS